MDALLGFFSSSFLGTFRSKEICREVKKGKKNQAKTVHGMTRAPYYYFWLENVCRFGGLGRIKTYFLHFAVVVLYVLNEMLNPAS